MTGRRISRILVQVPQQDDEETTEATATEDDGLEVSA